MKKLNLYIILLIAFSLPSYLIRFEIFGIPTTLLEILIYIAAIITLVQSAKCKVQNYNSKFKIILIPILLFVIGGLIGIAVSPDKISSLGQFRAYIFDPLIFFVVLLINIRTYKEVKNLLYALFYSGLYVSGYSIFEYLSNAPSENGRIIGIFGYSPNYAAMYMAPLVVLGFFLIIIDWKNKIYLNILKIILFAMLFVAIILSGSRGALLAIIGSIGLTYVLSNINNLKNNIVRITAVTIISIVILCIGYFLIKPDYTVSGDNAGRIGSSNNIRWEIYKTTFINILPTNSNYLLGVGLGNYQNYFTQISSSWVNYPEYIAPKALTAHNLFLHTWVSIGILGLIGLVWILIIFFRKTNFKDIYSFMLLSIMICILIQGIVDTPYWKNDLSIIFWILIFISLIINHKTIQNDDSIKTIN